WTKDQALRAADAARHDLPLVLLRTTRGDVLIQLFARDVPKGVEHFLDLVRRREGDRGFYDGTRFHRVEGAFLVQGGDPVSRDDLDAAGRSTGPTPVEVERNPRHRFFRGAVGFARGMALVNGSQFFVLTGSRPALDEGNFTCFGHVVAGMDVVDRLARGDTLLEAVVVRPAPTEEAREK
ncbi:MAG: peptidylprolyl isomerase, partial [Planctomycetota bacterium]